MTYSDKEVLRTLRRLNPEPGKSHFATLKDIAAAADSPVITIRKSIRRLHEERKIDAKAKPGRKGGITYRILIDGSDTD